MLLKGIPVYSEEADWNYQVFVVRTLAAMIMFSLDVILKKGETPIYKALLSLEFLNHCSLRRTVAPALLYISSRRIYCRCQVIVLFLFSAWNIELMLRYHENQLHFVTHSYLASIAAVLGVRHFPVNAENVSHLVSVSHRIGSNTHLSPAHRYCLYLCMSFMQNCW